MIGRFTHEDVFGKQGQTELDRLFLLGVLMSNLVWGIAIPYWLIEPSSLHRSGGVLVVTAWFLFPDHRFVAIPAMIVVYLISISALATRKLPPAPPGRGG